MAGERVQEALGRLLRRRTDDTAVQAAQRQAAEETPPYVRAVAVHESTTRLVVGASVVVFVGLLGLVAHQQWRISSLVAEVRAKEFLVVPGASDFVPVRANLIPDRVVTEFVRFFVAQMISVTDRNIDRRYTEMAHFLAPELEGRLDQELVRKAELLRALHGAEVWDAVDEPNVRRLTVDGRAVFEATLRGRVARYALGQVLESELEVVSVTFRTRASLGAEEPWVFEVVDFVRRSEDEHLRFERNQRIAKQGESR